MLIQTSLFCATILWGGTIKKLNDNSFDILNERVINRKIIYKMKCYKDGQIQVKRKLQLIPL